MSSRSTSNGKARSSSASTRRCAVNTVRSTLSSTPSVRTRTATSSARRRSGCPSPRGRGSGSASAAARGRRRTRVGRLAHVGKGEDRLGGVLAVLVAVAVELASTEFGQRRLVGKQLVDELVVDAAAPHALVQIGVLLGALGQRRHQVVPRQRRSAFGELLAGCGGCTFVDDDAVVLDDGSEELLGARLQPPKHIEFGLAVSVIGAGGQ